MIRNDNFAFVSRSALTAMWQVQVYCALFLSGLVIKCINDACRRYTQHTPAHTHTHTHTHRQAVSKKLVKICDVRDMQRYHFSADGPHLSQSNYWSLKTVLPITSIHIPSLSFPSIYNDNVFSTDGVISVFLTSPHHLIHHSLLSCIETTFNDAATVAAASD
jgi:hypothetical protein